MLEPAYNDRMEKHAAASCGQGEIYEQRSNNNAEETTQLLETTKSQDKCRRESSLSELEINPSLWLLEIPVAKLLDDGIHLIHLFVDSILSLKSLFYSFSSYMAFA